MLVRVALALAMWFVIPSLIASEGPASSPSGDRLLNQLIGIGNWAVERKFSTGQTAKYFVHAEWVLQNRFVQMHCHNFGETRTYEATVLIGRDSTGKRYVCHWTDYLGGNFSADGFAPRVKDSNVMKFKFVFPDYEVINRFVYNRELHHWTSTVRRTEKGKSRPSYEDTFKPTY